jgi:hypothetical protein
LRDTLAVPAMIANLGDHASRRLLEVLRWIAAGELVGARGSSSRSLLICIWPQPVSAITTRLSSSARQAASSPLTSTERMEKIYAGVDALSRKYSKHTVFLGSSFQAMKGSQHLTERGGIARRKTQQPCRSPRPVYLSLAGSRSSTEAMG